MEHAVRVWPVRPVDVPVDHANNIALCRGNDCQRLGSVVCITVSFVCHKLFVFKTRGNFLKEYFRAFVVYGGTSLVGFVLLPLVMAALNLFITPRSAVPYLAGSARNGRG